MNKHLRKPPWHFYIGAFFIIFTVLFPSHIGIGLPAPSINCTVESGASCGPTDCDYTFYIDGTTYLAAKGKGGGNTYSGSAASTVFQNAINAQGGGKYCFSSGTFDFAGGQAPPAGTTTNWGSLTAVGLILPTNSLVTCAGISTILTTTTAIPGAAVNDYFAMFVNKNPTTNDGNIGITNCQITLPSPTETATGMKAWDDGILLSGVHDSTFSQLTFTNGNIELYPSSTAVNTATVLTTGQNFNNLIIRNTFNQQTGNTVLFQATNSTIAFSTINQLWDDGFIIASAGQNNKIIGNTIFGKTPVNTKGALTAGIYLQNDGAVCTAPKTTCLTDNTIIGNTAYNITGHNSGSETGVYLLRAQNTLISENNLHGNAGWGVVAENSNNTIISHNMISFNTKDGVKIQASGASTFYGTTIDYNTIFDNGVNGQGNAGVLLTTSTNMILRNINVSHNMLYDDLATTRQTNALRLIFDGTINGLLVDSNNLLRSPTAFQTGGAGTLTAVQIINNLGYNPFGKTGNFVMGSNISPFGSGSTVVANTDYISMGPGFWFTSSGGTSVNITIKDPATNTLYAPGATLAVPFFVAYNYKVNFGGFSVAPTVSVWFD